MPSAKAFPNLQAKSFLHPNDASALKALQAIPVLGWGLQKVNSDQAKRLKLLATTELVTPHTRPPIYEMMIVCSKILDMPKVDVFIQQTSVVNACTQGVERPMIVVNSGLINLLNEEELLAVIAHEMGHVKCEHLLYHNAAIMALNTGGLFGKWGQVVAKTSLAALYKWVRESELSADRASLLVVQDSKVVVNLLRKLAGGSQQIASQTSYDDFVKQARAYREMSGANAWAKMITFFQTVFIDHPFAVMRAHEILDWTESDQYKNILSGNYIKTQEYVKCPHCSKMHPPNTAICPNTGLSTDKKPTRFWKGVLGKTIKLKS